MVEHPRNKMHRQPSFGDVRPSTDDESPTAVIYARTSSVNQKFGYSLEEQVRRCWERCLALEWRVRYIFKDEAESGEDTDRPQFQRMMSLARSGQFDITVFWKLDRFSRSILHAVELERELRQYDIALHSVTEQIDTSTSSGRFNFRNLASAAEFERDHIKERSQMGLKAVALQHGWPNRDPPLGYDITEDGKLEINTKEAALVKLIFELYCELQSMPKVAEELNEENKTTVRGNQWSARSIGKIIRNSIYCGRYSVAGVTDNVPEYRIISEDLFDDVTEIRHRFKRQRHQQSPMDEGRKRKYAESILKSYHEFLN